MSSQMVWRPHEFLIADTMTNNQVILDNRLSTLRNVALTLLREVESLNSIAERPRPDSLP